MKIKLYAFFEQLSGSFWFIPSIMVLVSIIASQMTISIDQSNIISSDQIPPWLYTGSPDGARSVLSTIAGSMISVAGVTFSITMVTLSLASSQLGPRLLNNFMRDRGNQVVLGTFISNFTYSLLILRSIRGLDEIMFVPHLSLTIAIVMVIISLGVLIYFFHHVSMMIQAQNLIAEIGKELDATVERLFSNRSDKSPYDNRLRNENDIPSDFDDEVIFINAHESGYLQAIDYDELLEIAENNDLILKFLYRPGDFIAEGSDVIALYGKEEVEEVNDNILEAIVIGTSRLRIQDIEYSIDQLVEIAVRALSPGINDPFTAIACLDQLSTTLSDIAERTIPLGYHYDPNDQLRIISNVVTFDGLVNVAFNQIRHYGRSDVAVTIRLLEVIAVIIPRTPSGKRAEALLNQVDMIIRGSEEFIFEENDRESIQKRYQIILDIQNKNKKGE